MRLGGISARCRGDAGGYCAARVLQVLEVRVQKFLELRNRHDFTMEKNRVNLVSGAVTSVVQWSAFLSPVLLPSYLVQSTSIF